MKLILKHLMGVEMEPDFVFIYCSSLSVHLKVCRLYRTLLHILI